MSETIFLQGENVNEFKKTLKEIKESLDELNTSLESLGDISYNIAILAMTMKDIKQMQECKML